MGRRASRADPGRRVGSPSPSPGAGSCGSSGLRTSRRPSRSSPLGEQRRTNLFERAGEDTLGSRSRNDDERALDSRQGVLGPGPRDGTIHACANSELLECGESHAERPPKRATDDAPAGERPIRIGLADAKNELCVRHTFDRAVHPEASSRSELYGQHSQFGRGGSAAP
jgi:hypothetical protein